MPIKVSVRNKVMTLTWSNEDQTMEAAWRLTPEASDEEIVSTLKRAMTFIDSQMPGQESPSDLDGFDLIMRRDASATTATTSAPTSPATDAIRIPMTSPAALSDRPADGGPPQGGFSWDAMPTTSIPPELAANPEHGWEMMPPEEMR